MYFRASILVGSLMMILFFQNCGQVAFSPGTATLLATNSVPGPIGGPGGSGDGPPIVANPPGSSTPPAVGDDSEAFVECDLDSPSNKIILGLKVSNSNSVNTRVCMSSNACLVLINAYVEARGGNLVVGAPTTPSAQANFTQVFPGSAGTCKNAQIIQDSDVANILADMAKQN
jgi:hypothetical protein